ncbi:transcriptional regulator [Haloplanus aerogenes]|uniref:Transcriptional regulator n=1 Tax=Haloplanus aerogenes TaxID=660522 RepID=A0A3M0DQ45_9EURY|nr:transcriptional regulator [Haloplanus aerogenes]AZH24539.1 transcriptional regulator [Haloplanus aerogenes]RMB23807.1 hypothetical protein ATH50_1037 [Haloplanus aerogenes]
MDSDDSGRSALSPNALTTRLDSVEVGDELRLNDRDRTFEVVGTERYAVRVVDEEGNEHTISQNLQSGGWRVHEAVWWVGTVDTDDS